MASYSGPERRNALPTFELWRQNIQALDLAGLSRCQMRFAFGVEDMTFLLRFENEVPKAKLNLHIPVVDPPLQRGHGWKKFLLTLNIEAEGRLRMDLSGRYERNDVPLDVKVEFERDITSAPTIDVDFVQFTDTRNDETIVSTFREILQVKMKDGTPTFCRRGDQVSDLPIEGMVAIAERWLRSNATRRKVLPKTA